MKALARLRRLWTGSLRRQLVIGVATVHAVLMTLLVADLVGRQRAILDDDVEKQASSIAEVVAGSAMTWVLANDVEGLDQLIDGLRHYPGLRDVMVLSPELKVLGHSERSKVGLYLDDPLSQRLRTAEPRTHTLAAEEVVDGVAPMFGAGRRHLGWARVRLTLDAAHASVAAARRSGLWYSLVAIALGVVFALLMAAGLTRDLRALLLVTDGVRRGEQRRSKVRRDDELGTLSDDLNRMLDVLDAQSRAQDDLRRAQEERAQLEEQLKRAQKMDALGKLAGGVAHDFNNLLMAIIANIELANEQTREGQAKRDLEEALRASDRARAVIAQVLAFSRNRVSERELVDLSEVVGDVTRLIAASMGGATIQTALEAPTAWVRGSATNLHQVAMNLCANARDALGGRGTATVRVRRRRAEGLCASCHQRFEGDFVELAVEDDGPGLSTEVKERLFEPFFTTRRRSGGSGLGLAMVHGVVHAHEGHMLVASQPGQTCFAALLPACDDRPQPAEVMPTAPVARSTGRLLVVDDEPMVARAVGRLLSHQGFEVEVELDPAAALLRAVAESFSAIITDHSMPGMTGLELARALRLKGFKAPIVLCTGNDSELGDTGAVDLVVCKPLDAVALGQRVAELAAR